VNKLIGVGLLGVGIMAMATGCSIDDNIVYQDKQMPVSEAEERIADQLEAENPDLDIEVDIYEEED
jgi:hypothetical protein